LDSGAIDAEAGVPDAAPDVETTDAPLSPVTLGITPSLPQADAASPSDQRLSELTMLAAGVRARALVVRLDDLLDPSGAPSDSVFADLAETAGLYRAHGCTLLFAIAVVDRTEDARPPALRASWSSAELRSALRAVIDRAYDTFGAELAYLSFGTDVDRFIALADADERAAFVAFIGQASSYAKLHAKRLPTTLIGSTFSVPGLLGDRLPETVALLQESEAAIVTDYPLEASFRAKVVSNAVAELLELADAIARDAPGLPIVVQELGYPSSTMVGSSGAEQQKFYQAAFSALTMRRDRFPFVNLYASADDDAAECVRQAATFGAADNPRLIAARCSLGLKDRQGVDKPAWRTVMGALSAFGRP
jgi:hypothetical protein